MRGLLIKGMDVTEVEVNGLEDYYREMEIDCIDIVTRKIGGKRYDVICDDEALLKENPIPTMFDVEGMPMLCGNLIIAGLADEEGNMTDLTDEDMVRITGNLAVVTVKNKEYACLINVKY